MEKERREEAWENEQAEDAEANGNEATAWAAADLAGSIFVKPAGSTVSGFEDCTGNIIAGFKQVFEGIQPRRILKRFRGDTKNGFKGALQIAWRYALPVSKCFERQFFLRMSKYISRQLDQMSSAIMWIVRLTTFTGSETGMNCLIG